MYNLKIISSTVRPGRKGPMIAAWIAEKAAQTDEFEIEILDLGEIKLPMMNEANHPIMKKYEHQHTRNWSAKIEAADAFIFVTAEYNFNYPAPLRNAIEYLYSEWNYKAAGIVSYGGISAGTRAANSLKADIASMSMIPLVHTVNFPMFPQFITEEGEFVPNENSHKSAETMLIELIRWTKGLKAIKENK